jgi:hypothetical protein
MKSSDKEVFLERQFKTNIEQEQLPNLKESSKTQN